MKTRSLILPSAFAAILISAAPALRAQAPAATHSSPGDHGQDEGRGSASSTAAPAKSRALHEAQLTPTAHAEEVEHGEEHTVKLFGFTSAPSPSGSSSWSTWPSSRARSGTCSRGL